VALPLTVTSYRTIQRTIDTRSATAAVENWLEGTAYDGLLVGVSGQRVNAAVEGSGALKPVQELAESLAITLDRPVTVVLRTVNSEVAVSKEP
jgi:hypothetical protein